MADEVPDESPKEPPAARAVVSAYLERHPHLDEGTVQHLVGLGSQFGQHFGEPAFA